MAQILETSLLNHLNYQTLIATKAARIRDIGRGQLMLEFGLRPGHDRGSDCGYKGSFDRRRGLYLQCRGVCHPGIPTKGTHAHSMVQLFIALGMSELERLRAYAEVYPDDTLLLVDTINLLEKAGPECDQGLKSCVGKGILPWASGWIR